MPRAFVFSLVGVNGCLAVAGAVYAWHKSVPAAAALPIVVAFLLQISFYLAPGFPEVRKRIEQRFSPARIAAFSVLAALVPYLVYSVPTAVFHFPALLELAAISGVLAFVFVIWPTRSPGL